VLTNGKNQAITESCQSLGSVCGNDGVTCPSVPCNEANLPIYVDKTMINDTACYGCPIVPRTLYNCSIACANQDLKDVSATILQDNTYLKNYTDFLDAFGAYADCAYVLPVLGPLQDQFCNHLMNTQYTIAVGNLIVGLFMVGLIVLLILGYKRFTVLHYVYGSNDLYDESKPRTGSDVGLVGVTMDTLIYDDDVKGDFTNVKTVAAMD